MTTSSGNKTLTLAEQLFKTLVWTPGINAGELALDVAVPELAIPVVHQAEDLAIDEVSDILYGYFITFVDVTTIKLKNSAHQTAYEQASINLIAVATASGVNSQEYIDAQNAELADLSKFTSITG